MRQYTITLNVLNQKEIEADRNHSLETHKEYKEYKRELLPSKTGMQKRKQRIGNVEPVFAELKQKYGSRDNLF
jgi:Transposase DDE domain